MLFCCKNALLGVGQNVGQLPDPHRDPHAEIRGKVERGADGDGFVLDVEVAPQESSQFTLAYGGILSRKKRSAQKKIITTSKLVV